MHTVEIPERRSTTRSLEFPFRWDYREHVRLHRAVGAQRIRHPLTHAVLWLGGLVLFGVASLVLFGAANARPELFWSFLPWMLIIGFWIALLRWGLPHLSAHHQRRQFFSTSPYVCLRVDEEGITTTCDATSTQIRWQGIQRVVETDEFLLFYFAKHCALYLPRRVIASMGERSLLDSLIFRKLGASRIVRTGGRGGPGWLGTAVLGIGALWLALLLMGFGIRPDRVLRGSELRSWDRGTLISEGYLDPDEEVLYLYSNGFWSIRPDGNLLTDRRVVSYEVAEEEHYFETVPYEEIFRIEVTYGEAGIEETEITVTTIYGEKLYLLASPYGDGDREFVDRLHREWRQRVPEGQERLAPKGAPEELEATLG